MSAMMGTVKELVAETRVGLIQTESGTRVSFAASAVMGKNFDFLTVGQSVSFELARGYKGPNAVNVQPEEPHRKVARDHEAPMQLQYLGFDQVQNVREYRFEGVTRGADTRHFTVDADLALFTKHHVGMQEGPVVCLRILTAELPSTAGQLNVRRKLTDADMMEYLSTRVVPGVRKAPRRWKNPRASVEQQST
jgi:CspA family cold shock protein